MIAGLDEITSGELWIDGQLCNRVEAKSRDIAMVFQNYALYPHMTVYKNMALGLERGTYPGRKSTGLDSGDPPGPLTSATFSTASPSAFPSGSGSGSLWAAQLSGTQRYF